MKRTDFRFFERLRVRWAEIDAQKIVFNGHYLTYLDTAITGYWRALALPYAQTMEALGGDLYVRKATLDYHASARQDDVLDVGMRCTRIGNSSMVFSGGIFRADALLVGGELVYVFADPAVQRARPVPPPLRAILEAYEGGEPMVDVQVGSWADLGEDARALRQAVFVEEQQIPAELEHDAADANAVHALARNRMGVVLATGRLLIDGGQARIGRMAVHATMRHGGIGRRVLDALVEAARERGARTVELHAQASARRFYARAGFTPVGAPFEEAGLEHQAMQRTL